MKKNIHIYRSISSVFLAMLLMLSSMPMARAATAYIGKITTDKVFWRMKPNKESSYYGFLNKNTKVAVYSVEGDFYKVRYNGKVGYIMRKFVELPSSSLRKLKSLHQEESKSKYAKTKNIKSLGKAPGNCQYGDSGVDVEKLQRALQLKKCYSGVVDGKFGNGTRDAVRKYQKTQKLSVTGKADYQTIKSLFGSVSETTAKTDPQMKGITSIRQISVPSTTKKGDSGKSVIALQQALKLKGYYKAPIDGKYGDGTFVAVEKFQRACRIKSDGIAGFSTIKKLFGKNAANYTLPTEKLDWGRGEGSKIPKGAIFTIKDIATGKTFTCKRWSGYNHLDAEPLNAQSTATLKNIIGGAWTWARRPVLVKYNGHVYAASINGMPHEDDTIPGNNFKGHFCVHFHNSKTHGSNRLDREHQNCVNRAMHASW